jgi:hypothetical protein
MAKDNMQKMMARAQEPEIYREVVVFTLGRAIVLLFVFLTLFFLGMLIDGVVAGHSSSGGVPDWFYAVMCLFFVLMTYVVINFGKLVIKATSRSITVKYGIFKREIPWKNVVDFYLDDAFPLYAYGGYGIRIGRVNGKLRLVYNVLGGERVVLALKKGRFNEFVFSTNNPDAVMDVIKRQIVDSK